VLFYVHGKLRDTAADLPRDRFLGMIASTWEALRQLEENGKVRAGGALIGRNAGVVIVDVDSHEELGALINRLPASAYLDWDVCPMMPAQSSLEAAKWLLQHRA
jgi:muconolactone delta-isomerase